MNIKTVERTLGKVLAFQDAGNHFEACQVFFLAQHQAIKCRSAKRRRVWDLAHVGANLQANKTLEISTNQTQRSEIVRIRTESFNFI